MISKGRARQMDIARAEGIVFTPQGEPLFARDVKRWKDILATPSPRSQAEIDEDDAAERAVDVGPMARS